MLLYAESPVADTAAAFARVAADADGGGRHGILGFGPVSAQTRPRTGRRGPHKTAQWRFIREVPAPARFENGLILLPNIHLL